MIGENAVRWMAICIWSAITISAFLTTSAVTGSAGAGWRFVVGQGAPVAGVFGGGFNELGSGHGSRSVLSVCLISSTPDAP